MQRDILGPRHRNVATTLNNLGFLSLKIGRLDDAERFLLEALDIYREVLGPDHIWTTIALENIALIHEERGTLIQAAPYIEQCLAIRRAALPPDHRMRLTIESLAAALAVERGQFEGAEAAILAACDNIRAARGDHHDISQRIIRRVVRMYQHMGELESAAAYAELLKPGP
jgi:tetratricopeptide (TPR) repeat protein